MAKTLTQTHRTPRTSLRGMAPGTGPRHGKTLSQNCGAKLMTQNSETTHKPVDEGPKSLSGVIDRAMIASHGKDRVSVQQLVEAMGPSSIVALLLFPALIVATPLSGIPGVSSVGGILIALISAQIVIGHTKAWLPEWLLRRSLPAHSLEQALGKLRTPAAHADSHLHRRLRLAAGSFARRILGLTCLVLGAAMPFLELIPLTSSIAAIAVTSLALAVLAGDGLVASAGLGMIGASVALISWLV